VQPDEILELLEAAYTELYPNKPLDFRTHSVLHLISQLPCLTKRLRRNKWLPAAIQVVVWVASIAKQQSKQSHACHSPADNKPSWYNLGGPHCQIGKTVFNALIVASCHSLHVPCFVLTYIAKSHVPDTCKKIRQLLQHTADSQDYSRYTVCPGTAIPWFMFRCHHQCLHTVINTSMLDTTPKQ